MCYIRCSIHSEKFSHTRGAFLSRMHTVATSAGLRPDDPLVVLEGRCGANEAYNQQAVICAAIPATRDHLLSIITVNE